MLGIHLIQKFRESLSILPLTILLTMASFIGGCGTPVDKADGDEVLSEVEYLALTIQTAYPGASPVDVEFEVTKRIEDELAAIEGLLDMHSISEDGLSNVILEFEQSTDLDKAILAVRAQLDSVILPEAAERPMILRYNIESNPIVILVVQQVKDGQYDITSIAKYLRDQTLQSVKGLSEVHWLGGSEREIRIVLDADRLAAHRVDVEDIVGALQSYDASESVSYLSKGDMEIRVRVDDELWGVKDLSNFAVPNHPGVRIKDIAEVRNVEKTTSSSFRFKRFRDEAGEEIAESEGEVVALQIFKDSDADTAMVVEDVSKTLEDIQSELPAGVKISITETAGATGFESSDERFSLQLETPPDILEKYTEQNVEKVISLLSEIPECGYLFSAVGGRIGEENVCRFVVGLIDAEFRESSKSRIMERVRALLLRIPAVSFDVRESPDLFSIPQVQFSLQGFDLNMMKEKAFEIMDRLKTESGVINLRTSMDIGKPTVEFQLRRELLAQLGVSASSVATTIKLLLGGIYVTKLGRAGDEIDVRLSIGDPETRDISDVGKHMVVIGKGKKVPLFQLVDILRVSGPVHIRRRNGKRGVLMSCDPAPGTSIREAAEIVSRVAEKVELPRGYSVEPVGRTKKLLGDE